MIQLKSICKTYGTYENETRALNNVSLSIERGEMVAVTGTSGSGKSTLLNILGGLDIPNSGNYYFDQFEVTKMNRQEIHAFRKQNIGFVFQNFALIGRYSAYENIELPLIARGVRNRRKIIMDCMEKLGIEKLADRRPDHLSGGQQQRVAIGRALVCDAPLLLCDEPTGALDEKTSMETMDLLNKIHEEGKTIIVVTHDLNIAARCDRKIIIADGEIKE